LESGEYRNRTDDLLTASQTQDVCNTHIYNILQNIDFSFQSYCKIKQKVKALFVDTFC
jgi:hypothetical protein